eukprot:TRINITY_DN12058_c0_g1_i1.p1 TRINITY_DN12058_c0_g1~~TRINITY_DN12058_c0_g1_i1.p1  ORF type:complete len:136 (-),score=44.38 TRINITY_DN12058_c0_g1_i1:109-492(-)
MGSYCRMVSLVMPSTLLSLVMFSSSFLLFASCLDLGSSGVFDSPLAADEYVRQFGFLFGGGRSGVQGLHALQDRDTFQQAPAFQEPSPGSTQPSVVEEKQMVELSPFTPDTSVGSSSKQFTRFLAVP